MYKILPQHTYEMVCGDTIYATLSIRARRGIGVINMQNATHDNKLTDSMYRSMFSNYLEEGVWVGGGGRGF